eukprot:TRINITY_DN13313_c0_g1_i1.p1 TRINITY_DN13313_c0_g1~~TRINITY_DN13313_c0_g1_i1.p1  ORF type:complete len:202 (-),score=40.54 TRINITY_DN13313_c0_g1_i1:197-802(-)
MGFGSSKLQRELEERNRELEALKKQLEQRDAALAQVQKELTKWQFTGDHDDVFSTLAPMASQLGLGSTLGYATGYALNVAGRIAAIGLGTGFVGLQTLSYLGYVQVDWRKIERDYTAQMDTEYLARKTLDVLAFNLPAGFGFTGGLLYGLGTSASKAAVATGVVGMGARVLGPRVALAGMGAAAAPAVAVQVHGGDKKKPE